MVALLLLWKGGSSGIEHRSEDSTVSRVPDAVDLAGSGMGAVLSPAISGTLRDATGNWTAAVMLDAGIMLVSFVLLLFVREPRGQV